MRSRMFGSMSGASILGLGVGLIAGAAAGLLMAPMRGREMRGALRSRSERLRTRADQAYDRGMMLLEEGRRAFRTTRNAAGENTPLTATLGEIAQIHSGSRLEAGAGL